MKKFSPPEMKEVSFPTPYTPHPTPSFKSGELRMNNIKSVEYRLHIKTGKRQEAKGKRQKAKGNK